GRATAHLFADEGARVVATDVDEAGLDRVVAEIREAGGEVHGWRLDVADGAAIRSVVEAAAARLGGIDVLVNNAGIVVGTTIDAEDYEVHWQRALDVLLTAHVRLVRACLPHLRRAEAGRIINIA